MKKHRITIKDIAQKLDISPSTVSRALKDHPDINPKTKKSVKEMAEKHHYIPNKIALGLLQNQSNTIGVIIPEIIHHFFSSVISGIENAAYKEGYNVMICQSMESYEKEVKNVQTLLSNHIDGLLISISKETRDCDHLKNFREIGLPLVFFDRIAEDIETDKVIVDDYGGAYKATQHLISMGCKRIAHFYGPLNLLIGTNRYNGYTQALKDNNYPLKEEYMIFCDSFEDAVKQTEKILQLPEPPDAIFTVNDLTAAGAMKVITEKGYNIPDDIAIVGFTNSFISPLTNPTLSTIDQNGYTMGQEAAKILFQRIKEQSDKKTEPITKLLDTDLIVRESSKRKKK